MSLPVRSPVPAPPQRGDWERYKQRIAHLYLEENKPLREVADIMRIEHDFTATYVSAPPQEKAIPEPRSRFWRRSGWRWGQFHSLERQILVV
ncbi:hypothetical protein G7054_g15222 [Neopestalotiopsis clavispora]|nr:hypothetical protein G7054_g15222 [Neopestalotiopsis clavispora]